MHVFVRAIVRLAVVLYLFVAAQAMAAIQCYECHGTKSPVDYRPLDSSDRNPATGSFPGNHRSHLSPSARPEDCAKCHPGSADYTSSHRDGVIKVAANINASPEDATYKNTTSVLPQISADQRGTCSNVNCHFEKITPKWGAGGFKNRTDCNKCHGAPPADGSHAAHDNYFGPGSASCAHCHTDHASEAAPFAHATSVGKRSLILGVPYTKATNAGYPAYLPSRTGAAGRNGNCSNTSCHEGSTVTWGKSACLQCHSRPQGKRAAITAQFGANSHHVQGGITDAHCYQCHWEANSDGSINSAYHGSKSTGAPVHLVVYGAGERPSNYTPGETAIQYTANGTRGETEKISQHCLGCHSDRNNAAQPFSDGKTPRQYAWDSTSVAARYLQPDGTTRWGKYSSANGANKRITKAYSAHGNAAANKRGWSAATGVDGAITDSSGATNVQCFDCHNSHGSSVSGVTTRYASATVNGGILKDTTFAGAASPAYKPYSGGSAARKNRRNPGASLCLDCHLTPSANTKTPWGYASTYGATQPILGYADAPFMGATSAASAQRSYYKGLKTAMGGHFGASSPLKSTPNGSIDGLCTPCHDPHGVSPSLGSKQEFAVPLLKETYVTSPYREDRAPAANTYLTARSDVGKEGVGYNIDQNTFGTGLIEPVTKRDLSTEDTAGLCLGCHPKTGLTNGSNHTWKSKDRIHESVGGWKTSPGTAKHAYTCSKCHSSHAGTDLPRLMVTNCMDSKHKGRYAYNSSPVLTASGNGHTNNFYSARSIYCSSIPISFINTADPYNRGWCQTREGGPFAGANGSGTGRFPGSWRGDNQNFAGGTEHNVACHESQTYSTTDQSWNVVTPWYPTLTVTVTPYAYLSGSQVVVNWSTSAPGTSTVDYGPTTGYGTTVTGTGGSTYHSVTLPTSTASHYRVRTTSPDGQGVTSSDYFFDVAPPVVTGFSATQPDHSLDIPLTMTASDDTEVTGYMVTVSSTRPSATDYGWTSAPPASYRVTATGSYTLYPWAKDAKGNVSAPVATPVTLTVADSGAPAGVANSAPRNGATGIPSSARVYSTVGSDPVSGGVQYLFEVALDEQFNNVIGSSGWVSSPSYAPPLNPGTTYYWHVKARDGALNETLFTPYWSFTTGTTSTLWTTRGDFQNNAATTGSPTVRSGIRISGSALADNASVSYGYRAIAVGGGSNSNGSNSSLPNHTLAVKSDGSLWAWGSGGFGQLGDGTTPAVYYSSKAVPVQVAGFGAGSRITSIAAGGSHSLAVRDDGSTWSWGQNWYGQIGDGTGSNRFAPGPVSGLGAGSGVVQVAAGEKHSLAVKSDGTVWAWGYNQYGQLGNGTTINNNVPVQLTNLSGVVSVAASGSYSVAVTSDGTVWAWGQNNYGQLGNGTTANSLTPVQVTGLSGVVAVAAGGTRDGTCHVLALRFDGTLWAWGSNGVGELGDGTRTMRTTPVRVWTDLRIISIAAGESHSVAVTADGSVLTWGFNNNGQIGNNNYGSIREIPEVLSSAGSALLVGAGPYSSLAVTGSGTLVGWGRNDYGQLGDGNLTYRPSPVELPGLGSDVVLMAPGSGHTLAVKEDGSVWSWGYNSYGALGDGSYSSSSTPHVVPALQVGVVAAAAGQNHSLALKNDGTVWAWGENYLGKLGNNSTTSSVVPVPVTTTTGMTGIARIDAGQNHSLALATNGTVWAWGANGSGQLGDGSANWKSAPVPVSGLTGIAAISAGLNYSLALDTNGTVTAWGDNMYGQVGDGTQTARVSPVTLSGLPPVKAFAAGGYHTLAVLSDGTVQSWGYNYYGQLGDTTTSNRNVPGAVTGLDHIIDVAAGYYFSLALKDDGTVWAWGANDYGQLGNGSMVLSKVPVQVPGLSNVVAIAAKSNYSFARTADGTIWGWGGNYNGQLGDGYSVTVPNPVQSLFSGIVPLPGTVSGLKMDAGVPVTWGSVFWNGTAFGNSSVRFRTRGAPTSDGLSAAAWSEYLAVPGSGISTTASRWLELEMTLNPEGSIVPTVDDFAVTYSP